MAGVLVVIDSGSKPAYKLLGLIENTGARDSNTTVSLWLIDRLIFCYYGYYYYYLLLVLYSDLHQR